MRTTLPRRLVAEWLGSALLAAVVIGSGVAAQQLTPGNIGLELFYNAAATAAGLYALILMFGPVSGGHFNPVVSLVDALFGGLRWRDALSYVPAQVGGCISGAVLANVMFNRTAVSISTRHRATGAHFISEIVATTGLLLVIFALARTGRAATAPAAVGAYIGAAYWFTSSTSFANPAITVGRMFSNTFAGIAPSSAPAFIAAQIAGGVVAWAIIKLLYPAITPAEASEVVVPHLADAKPVVLFLCIHNSGRSLAAKVLLDHYSQGRVEVRSAGSEPGHDLNPAVVAVLAERGLDTSKEVPKPLTDSDAKAADVVVTMGCGDSCPFYPGKRYLDWELKDPAGLPVEEVRPIVDDIDRRVQALLAELVPPAA